jgi:flavin reductase (DIM6/NTAB) family NADH-FMN oxidoreductase RutF
LACGRSSGKTSDKFSETGLTPLPARKVKAPIVKECIAHLECKLRSQFKTGDHTIFIGEIVEAYADKGVFTDKYDVDKARMLFHLGGNVFATLDPKVYAP